MVPAATQRLVASWLRRQRSCCAAARRGNLELARRLKPSDLWLDWEEHSVAATRAWAWDLRPLERGLPAIPLGAVPTRPRTGIRLEAVEEARGWCVDKAILHELEWGIRDDADLPMGTLLCAPHGGALKFIVQAEEKVAKSVAAGWVTIHSDLPMWPIRCPPGSVVDETERAGRAKHRATDDLSWPHAGCVGAPSSNDAMRRHEWAPVTHVRVPQLASAAATFETVGPLRGGCHACRIWGWDATAYYKVMARAVDEVWRQCRVDPRGRFGVDERAVFGCAAAAVKGGGHASNVIAQAVQRRLQAFDDAHPPSDPAVRSWLAARRRLLAGEAEAEVSRLFVFGVYVDDGCGLSVDDELGLTTSTGGRWRRAAMHFRLSVEVLHSWGHVSEPSKEVSPARCSVVLGLCIDLDAWNVRLDDGKRVRYARMCRAVSSQERSEVHEFKGVLGKLTFAAYAYPVGRQWLCSCWRALKVAERASLAVVVSPRVRGSLLQWAVELEREGHEGVPLACRELAFPPWGEESVCAVYADASGESGYSAWTLLRAADGADEVVVVGGLWSAQEKAELTIAELELWASTIGLVTLQPLTGASYVWEWTDNTVAMAAIRSLTPSSAAMQEMVAARVGWMLARGVLSSANRITSKNNVWADVGSRAELGGVAEVLRLARAAGYRAREVAAAQAWRRSEWVLRAASAARAESQPQ